MRSADARPLAPTGVALLGVVSAASAAIELTVLVAVVRAVTARGAPGPAAALAAGAVAAVGLVAGHRAARHLAGSSGPAAEAALPLGHLSMAGLVASATWLLVAVPPRLSALDDGFAALAVGALVAGGLGLAGGAVQALHTELGGAGLVGGRRDRTALLTGAVTLVLGGLLLMSTDEIAPVARRAALAEAVIAALVLGVLAASSGGHRRLAPMTGGLAGAIAAAVLGLTVLTGSTSPGGLIWSALAGVALAACGVAVALGSVVRRWDTVSGLSGTARLAVGASLVLLAVTWRGLAQSDTSPEEVLAAAAVGVSLAAVAAVPRLGRRRWSLDVVAAVIAGAAWPRPGGWPAAWAIVATLVGSGLLVAWFPDDPLRTGPLRARLPAAVAVVGSLWILVPEWGPYGTVAPTLAGAAVVLALAPSWRWAATDPTGRTRPLLVAIGALAFLPAAVDRGAPFAQQSRTVAHLAVLVAVAIAVVDARRATIAAGAPPPPARDRRLVPPVLAVPGMLWLLVNVTIWSQGALSGDDWAYAAWAGGVEALPVRFATVDGALALPALLPAVLYVGACLAVEGRRSLVRSVAGLTVVGAAGIACGALATWGAA